MAETSVPITAGAGTPVAVFVDPAGFDRQVMVLGDSVAANVAKVDANGSVYNRVQDSTGAAVGSIVDGAGVTGLGVAMMSTNYTHSTVNSTVAQLATTATFTGTIETVYNQQNIVILVTSDQAGTLHVKQYIDLAGTRLSSDYVVAVVAGAPMGRSFVASGNYYNVTFTNNGGPTTTTLNVDTALGTLPSSTNLGNAPVSIAEVGGVAVVTKSGGMPVKGASPAGASSVVTAATPVTGTGLDCSEAGNVTFVFKNFVAGSPFTGTPVFVFEQSDDNVQWGPLPVTSSTGLVSATQALAPAAANYSQMFDAGLEGVNWVRWRCTTASIVNNIYVITQLGGMAFSPSVGIAGGAKVTAAGRQMVGPDHLLFHGMFSSAAQNTGVWKHISSTMTASQTGGYLVLNTNSSLTSLAGCSIQSWRYVSFIDASTYTATIQVLFTANPLALQTMEWGLFIPTATAAPTEGVYFRYSTAGLLGVVNNNGTETTILLGAAGFFTASVGADTSIVVDERSVQFYSGGILLGSLGIGATSSNIFQSLGLPLGIQCRNTSTVTGTPAQLKIACTSIFQNDISLNKPWAHQQQSIGYGYQGLEGGVMGSTALIANNQNTAAAALVNASAAAGFTGLGGHFNVLPTLTVGTDGILCDYTNPLGSTTQPARTMHITGVRIEGAVMTAFTGGAVAYLYTLCHGHTATSLLTAETASFVTGTTKAPRRVYLGTESFPITSAVGAVSVNGGVSETFQSPIVVNPGEHVAIAAKNMGIVTSAGAICIGVGFDYYYE